ncbi:hypothetical protein WJX81_004797 [Elliptochloris bilobata]|uniref:Uncharacterized protein n=1 Tax=Elliptochloris bilobata TaxID=381761 RepID=A0AAW1S4D1_9CHLO
MQEVLPLRRPKRKAAEPVVAYEQLARHGFDGGPSLTELAEEVGRRDRAREAAEAEAAEQRKTQKREEDEEEERRLRLTQLPKKQKELDEDRPHVVTHGERRGTLFRQQAEARWEVQSQSGDALSLAAYAGVAGAEAEAEQRARAALAQKRRQQAPK